MCVSLEIEVRFDQIPFRTLRIGRCYEADSVPHEMPFLIVSFIAGIRFWPKTMDYT